MSHRLHSSAKNPAGAFVFHMNTQQDVLRKRFNGGSDKSVVLRCDSVQIHHNAG